MFGRNTRKPLKGPTMGAHTIYPADPLTKLAGTIHETSGPHKLHFSPTIAQIVSVVQVHSALTKTELMGGKC